MGDRRKRQKHEKLFKVIAGLQFFLNDKSHPTSSRSQEIVFHHHFELSGCLQFNQSAFMSIIHRYRKLLFQGRMIHHITLFHVDFRESHW